MRFNNPSEVLVWANKVASEDYQRHLDHGIDLNPYCTAGARNDWQRGYDGKGPRSYSLPLGVDYDTMYQRGAAMRKLIDAK